MRGDLEGQASQLKNPTSQDGERIHLHQGSLATLKSLIPPIENTPQTPIREGPSLLRLIADMAGATTRKEAHQSTRDIQIIHLREDLVVMTIIAHRKTDPISMIGP